MFESVSSATMPGKTSSPLNITINVPYLIFAHCGSFANFICPPAIPLVPKKPQLSSKIHPCKFTVESVHVGVPTTTNSTYSLFPVP